MFFYTIKKKDKNLKIKSIYTSIRILYLWKIQTFWEKKAQARDISYPFLTSFINIVHETSTMDNPISSLKTSGKIHHIFISRTTTICTPRDNLRHRRINKPWLK